VSGVWLTKRSSSIWQPSAGRGDDAKMLATPFRSRTTHAVKLRSIGVERAAERPPQFGKGFGEFMAHDRLQLVAGRDVDDDVDKHKPTVAHIGDLKVQSLLRSANFLFLRANLRGGAKARPKAQASAASRLVFNKDEGLPFCD
jgi:hypothetical protein